MSKEKPKSKAAKKAAPKAKKPAAKRGMGPASFAAVGLIPEPHPSITDPQSGTTVTGGTNLALTVSTNRPDVTHTVRVKDSTGAVVGSPVTVTFPNGSPRTVTVPVPAAGTTTGQYLIEVFTTATPPGTTASIVITVPPVMMMGVTPDPAPDGETGAYVTDQDITFTAAADGGSGTYEYVWVLTGPITDTYHSPGHTYGITTTYTGTYTLRVISWDTSDPPRAATTSFTFDVVPAP